MATSGGIWVAIRAHLHAVAIDGQRLARQGVDDHQRDQLFREVIGPVVVAAVGGDHRQAGGVVPGAHQMVAGGLAGRVGAIWLVAVRLSKGRVARPQTAIHLIGRNMQKAEGRLGFTWKAIPVAAHLFKQVEGADDVGLDEVARAVNGTIDVAFGGKVDDGTGLMLGQQAGQQGAVTNVAANLPLLAAHLAFRHTPIGTLVQPALPLLPASC